MPKGIPNSKLEKKEVISREEFEEILLNISNRYKDPLRIILSFSNAYISIKTDIPKLNKSSKTEVASLLRSLASYIENS